LSNALNHSGMSWTLCMAIVFTSNAYHIETVIDFRLVIQRTVW